MYNNCKLTISVILPSSMDDTLAFGIFDIFKAYNRTTAKTLGGWFVQHKAFETITRYIKMRYP